MGSAIVTIQADSHEEAYYYDSLRGYPWMYCRSERDARRWIEAFVSGAAEFSDGAALGPSGYYVIVLLEDERRVPPAMPSIRFEGLTRVGAGRWRVVPAPRYEVDTDRSRYFSQDLRSINYDRIFLDEPYEQIPVRSNDRVDALNYAWSRVNAMAVPPSPPPRTPTDDDLTEYIKVHGWGLLQATHTPMRQLFAQRLVKFAQNLRAFIEAIPAPYEGINAFIIAAARLERTALPVELDRRSLVSDDNDWHRERYALIEL
jgi:hypothetical protein